MTHPNLATDEDCKIKIVQEKLERDRELAKRFIVAKINFPSPLIF